MNVSPATSGSGSGSLSLFVARNSFALRQGTVTVSGKPISVTQTGGTCTATLSSRSASFGSGSGTGAVAFTLNNNSCPWTAYSSAFWIALDPTSSSGVGASAIPFSVAANPGFIPRTGQITLGDQTFQVTQSAGLGLANTSGYLINFIPGGYQFSSPGYLIAKPDGSVYISETGTSRVMLLDPLGGTTVVAGGGKTSLGDGGPATLAMLGVPMGLAFDAAGNLYIADNLQNRIRKVNSSGIISTYAGTGVAGYNGDGAPASTLQLNGPSGIAFDAAGNLFISDSQNARIRKVAVDGTMTTVAGTGEQVFSGDGGPAISAALRIPGAIAIDRAGNIFIDDLGNYRVRKISLAGGITTVAGNGTQGTSADLSIAASNAINIPIALSTDQNGVLYIGEYSGIRKVGLDGLLRTVMPGLRAGGLFADNAGNVWESDSSSSIYKLVPVPSFCSYTVSPPAAQVSAGGTLNLTVTTAPGCSWSALSNTPWITYTGATGLTANFTLSPNATQATRTGTIAIAGQNVTISQNASALNPTVFVTALYQDLLNRAPDPGGLNYYVTYINDATLTKAQAAAQFFTSPEFSSAGLYVIKLYFAVLKRDPDFAGWKYWFDTMHSGLPPTTVLNSFINSPEFQQLYGSVTNANFVNLVYQNVLGRQPDTAGYAYWLKLIDDGSITRAVLMDDFVRSPEYDNSVRARAYANLLYMGFLRRAADPAGLTFWTSVLNDPAALPEAIRGFILSPEYLNRF